MHAVAATGAGFLMAVLWFDLMFDVQTRKHVGATLPSDVLASISAYYRRVTTEATPMNRLVSLVMVATVSAIVAGVVSGASPRWFGWTSLVVAASAIGLAAVRTVRNAVRLGGAGDSPDVQSRLARAIYRDHVFCFVAMSLVVGLQLSAAS
jgi:hypothetical protein